MASLSLWHKIRTNVKYNWMVEYMNHVCKQQEALCKKANMIGMFSAIAEPWRKNTHIKA